MKVNEECEATITINGETYACEMSASHEGRPHVARVKVDAMTYDGVEWLVDAKQGNVHLEMSSPVAYILCGPKTVSDTVEHIQAAVADLANMAHSAGSGGVPEGEGFMDMFPPPTSPEPAPKRRLKVVPFPQADDPYRFNKKPGGQAGLEEVKL
jgi:hypothetical protein